MRSLCVGAIICLLVSLACAHTVKHVIFVMEENRSFDHLFGWASDLLGIDGLTGKEWNPTTTLDPFLAERVYVTKNASLIGLCDPDHAYNAMTSKIYGLNNTILKKSGFDNTLERMDGFVEWELWNGKKNGCYTMDMFATEKLPVMMTLAAEYAIMDRFFCSVPGPTWPNRQFAMAATSGGSTETFFWANNEFGKLFPQKTFFDQLEEQNHTWKVYYVDTPWELFMEKLAKSPENVQTMDSFYRDLEQGTLPSYSFVNPRSAMNVTTGEGSNDMHPDHDMALGEKFLKEIYEAVRGSPSWNDTLLILGFDENGGFYDHVPPPSKNIPPPDDLPSFPDTGFRFDRLGIRIPTILISPWIRKGTVITHPPEAQKPFNNSEYELTSIMATTRKLLNMDPTPLTKRDAWAATFEHVLEGQQSPRTDCPVKLPNPMPPSAEHSERERRQPINGLQQFMIKTLADLHGYDPAHEPERHAPTQADAGQWLHDHYQRHRQATINYKRFGTDAPDEEKPFDLTIGVLLKWLPEIAIEGAPFFNLNPPNVTNSTSSASSTTSKFTPAYGVNNSYGVTFSTKYPLIAKINGSEERITFCIDYKLFDAPPSSTNPKKGKLGVSPCYPSIFPGRNHVASQLWDWMPDSTMRPHGQPNLCVTTHVWSGDQMLWLEDCNGSVEQHWMYDGPAPGSADSRTIQFGNGIYLVGAIPRKL